MGIRVAIFGQFQSFEYTLKVFFCCCCSKMPHLFARKSKGFFLFLLKDTQFSRWCQSARFETMFECYLFENKARKKYYQPRQTAL